jgi:hypothetical protein
VRDASPLSTAIWCNSCQPKFQCTAPLGLSPWVAKGVANSEEVEPLDVVSMYFDKVNRLSMITEE